MVLVNLLLFIDKEVKAVKAPSDEGMVPLKSLLNKCKEVRAGKFPSD
jgi:hypothetical protein